jgi:hypothetical protein
MGSTGTLYRPATGRDQNQGKTQRFGIVVGDVDFPCDAQPASASTVAKYRQNNILVNVQVYLVKDIKAQANDMMTVKDYLGNESVMRVHGYKKNLFARFQSPYVADCEELK